jgi:hypothetical protein
MDFYPLCVCFPSDLSHIVHLTHNAIQLLLFKYLVDVWIFLGVGQNVERRVKDVEHPHDFHDSVGVGIASAQITKEIQF